MAQFVRSQRGMAVSVPSSWPIRHERGHATVAQDQSMGASRQALLDEAMNQESSKTEEAREKSEDTKDEQVIDNSVDSAEVHKEARVVQDYHCTAIGLMQIMEARMMQSVEDMFPKYLRVRQF